MPNLLEISTRILDTGVADEPVNRVTQELSELAPGIALVESFSHVIAVEVGAGLLLVDASSSSTAPAILAALDEWRTTRVDTLVYTHGHLDHVAGSGAILDRARTRGDVAPTVVAHEAVAERFRRYRRTAGWNRAINERQFGWLRPGGAKEGTGAPFLPDSVVPPDVTFTNTLELTIAGSPVELHHARGETDDHVWAWLPEHRAVCSGDLLTWHFPNAGNPQKVQRYPDEWAAALRAMAAKRPELLLPAHGLPIAGADRIAAVLTEVADVLDALVRDVLEMMNTGASLDAVLQSVRVSEGALTRPFLTPTYDEPEFVIRGIWRLYGGWWDGNPARLKPAPDEAIAGAVAELAGGTAALAARTTDLLAAGELRLACQLADWAVQVDPASGELHALRVAVYEARGRGETSLMAKGIYAAAAQASREPDGRLTR